MAREEYGYAIVCAIALAICGIGLWLIASEKKKNIDDRSAHKIMIGIIVASGGSFMLLMAIFYLIARRG